MFSQQLWSGIKWTKRILLWNRYIILKEKHKSNWTNSHQLWKECRQRGGSASRYSRKSIRTERRTSDSWSILTIKWSTSQPSFISHPYSYRLSNDSFMLSRWTISISCWNIFVRSSLLITLSLYSITFHFKVFRLTIYCLIVITFSHCLGIPIVPFITWNNNSLVIRTSYIRMFQPWCER